MPASVHPGGPALTLRCSRGRGCSHSRENESPFQKPGWRKGLWLKGDDLMMEKQAMLLRARAGVHARVRVRYGGRKCVPTARVTRKKESP